MMKLKRGGATSACMAMALALVFCGAPHGHVQADPLACQPNEEFPMLCVCHATCCLHPRKEPPMHACAVCLSAPGAIRLTAGWRRCRPTYHLIGNVTKSSDGSIKLEPINDASGVTYKDGIYHAWHQCCQNHWFAQCLPLRRRLQPDCSRTVSGRSLACTAPRHCDSPLTALCGLAGTMPFRRT